MFPASLSNPQSSPLHKALQQSHITGFLVSSHHCGDIAKNQHPINKVFLLIQWLKSPNGWLKPRLRTAVTIPLNRPKQTVTAPDCPLTFEAVDC